MALLGDSADSKFEALRRTEIRNIRFISIVLGLIGIAFMWWAFKKPIVNMTSEIEVLQKDNAAQEEKLEELKELYGNMDFYKSETVRLLEETEEVLLEFPTYMYLEDQILYTHDMEDNDLNKYNTEKLSYSTPSLVVSSVYGGTNDISLYSINMTGTFQEITYEEFKDFLQHGYDTELRFVLENVSVSYSSVTGYLAGSFTYTTYFITGQTTPYEFPQEALDLLGTTTRDNIFGSREEMESKVSEAEE